MSNATCSVDGCGKEVSSRGLCGNHYYRLKRYGDVQKTTNAPHKAGLKWLAEMVLHQGDDCLVWPFGKYRNGYGCVHIDGVSKYAHREMCLLSYGPAPEGKPHACHSCGNGHLGCVNPSHLKWASASENMTDKLKHGTAPRGSNCGTSKLTWEQADRIRAERPSSTLRAMAMKYGVSETTIFHIAKGNTWVRPLTP